MKHEYKSFLAEAVSLFKRKRFQEATASFETLLCLLKEERLTDETLNDIKQVKKWIEKSTNPDVQNMDRVAKTNALAAMRNQKEPTEKKKAKPNPTRCIEIAKKLFVEQKFEEAAKKYAEWLSNDATTDPIEIGDTYWNIALCYQECACAYLVSGQLKEEFLHNAIEAITCAIMAYPASEQADIETCRALQLTLETSLDDLVSPEHASEIPATSEIDTTFCMSEMFQKATEKLQAIADEQKEKLNKVVEALQTEVELFSDLKKVPTLIRANDLKKEKNTTEEAKSVVMSHSNAKPDSDIPLHCLPLKKRLAYS